MIYNFVSKTGFLYFWRKKTYLEYTYICVINLKNKCS